MKKRKVLGVRCNVVRPYVFRGECVVKIGKREYYVHEINLELTDEQPKRVYVKALASNYDRARREYILYINANSEVIQARAKESQLVFA